MKELKEINLKENSDKIILNNGLNIIFDHISNHQSVCIGFFLKKGSRDENNNQLGYSHFSEHMIFKGTKKYDQKFISNYFDKVGGYINAYTTQELIVLYNKVPKIYLNDTIKFMCEIFLNSIFDKKEFEVEKSVIINELHSEFEDAHEKIHEYFMNNLFPDQGLGLPIIGNEDSISNCKRDNLFEFYKDFFSLDDLLIVISGDIDKDKIINLFEKIDFKSKKVNIFKKKAQQGKKKFFKNFLPSKQAHIILGTSKFKINKEEYIRLGLLNIILGESMSSRFYQRIREELGLCYSIYTFYNKFREENIFGLYTSVLPGNINKTIIAISETIRDLIKNGISINELENAKTQKIGELILNYDILHKRIHRIAFMDITLNKMFTYNQIIKIILDTTLDELNNMAKNIFIRKNLITQLLYKKNLEIGEWKF